MITYVVTYFDLDGTARFLPLLEQWLAYARASIPSARIAILTDNATRLPVLAVFGAEEVVRVDPILELCRPLYVSGAAFDYKAALICSALRDGAFAGPVLICDTDATIHNDPTDYLLGNGWILSMPPDPGKRVIPVMHSVMDADSVEHSSCAMFFKFSANHREIVDAYWRAYFALSKSQPEKTGINAMLREQRAWTVTRLILYPVSPLLPAEFGWSPQCWGENPQAYIRHAHGAKKWEILPALSKA